MATSKKKFNNNNNDDDGDGDNKTPKGGDGAVDLKKKDGECVHLIIVSISLSLLFGNGSRFLLCQP